MFKFYQHASTPQLRQYVMVNEEGWVNWTTRFNVSMRMSTRVFHENIVFGETKMQKPCLFILTNFMFTRSSLLVPNSSHKASICLRVKRDLAEFWLNSHLSYVGLPSPLAHTHKKPPYLKMHVTYLHLRNI